MKTNSSQERMQMLLDELIVYLSTRHLDVSEEELLFSFNCLLRACQGMLGEDQNWEYIETKFNAAYNLLTGRTVYPF
ncbi:hypothetical protein [Ectobacillus panaciterrae]|uniref:hypothetical protein n=1 Tax=Ectobacillus panaciterrae TaxID=363872 RepID=UPI000400F9FF|nr:hypothetical protein [Ectobacillus panaciterrae]